MPVTGWKLDPAERAELLRRFPPEWPDVVADHVTLDAKAGSGTPLPAVVRAEIVGTASDGTGLQAMVVAIDQDTARPDGGTYHITWSLDRSQGRKPVESNDLIADRGWRRLDRPVAVKIAPARWD